MTKATAGTLSRRQALRATTAAAAALGLGALAPGKAMAQGTQPRAPGTDYPSRPVRVVVAFAPGGNADITARLISAALSAQTGQQFVVENRPSGGGVVASEVVAQSAPDGYTILVGALSTHVLNVGLFKHLPVDPLTGFEHITISSSAPPMLVVRPTLPVHSLAEFRDLLKREPGRYQYGSAGNGSTGHIAAALLLHQLGVEAEHVPYRGSAPAFTDLAAGRIDFMVDTLSFLTDHVREGTVRALFVGTKERSPLLPEVPTAAEAGLPQYEASTWTPWSAPKDTSADIVRFLYEQIQVALGSAEVLDRLRQLGNAPMPGMTPERTRTFIAAEMDKWLPIVRATGVTID